MRTATILALTSLVYLGCGAPQPDDVEDGPGGKADVINPVEKRGSLIVQPPASVTNFYPATLSLDHATLGRASATVGTPVGLSEGRGWCLGVKVPEIGAPEQVTDFGRACGIEIVAQQTTPHVLPSLRVHWDQTSNSTLITDFGPTARLRVLRSGVNISPRGEAWSGAATRDLLALPGDYEFSFGLSVIPIVKRTVVLGQIADIDLSPRDVRATVRVLPPASRQFPDARGTCPANAFGLETWLTTRPSNLVPEQSVRELVLHTANEKAGLVPSRAALAYRVFPFGSAEVLHYEISVSNTFKGLDVKPGNIVEVPLKRIDVNDVEIRDVNGSHLVAGRYTVRYQSASGRIDEVPCASNIATKTGIDVLPGLYYVKVDFTNENGSQTQEHTLDLR